MKLQDLLKNIAPISVAGNLETEIAGVHSDSRQIKQGWLFVAVKGTQADGHNFIGKAIENGATAVVVADGYDVANAGTGLALPAVITVADTAAALGILASQWYGNPSERLSLVGVTGTNGKTTTATLLWTMFRRLGYKAGLLSTVCNFVDDRAVSATHTTPDPLELNALLAEMVDAGCDYAFMEVSSHAVDQRRISGLRFKGGIFTNLTRDHLDYHKTFEAYRDAKKGFFDALPVDAFALTNKDDKNGMFMLQNTKAKKYSYSLLAMADFKGKIIEKHFEGTEMTINGHSITTQFVGVFNAYNLLAVYGAATLLHEGAKEEILRILSTLTSVAGRFQTFRSKEGFTAIVDYAHTPDALTNVLNAIHEVLSGKGRIITVVGCGGNRDKGKRPIMAKEAVRLSDLAILTSDNPRFEEPEDILADMFAGLDEADLRRALKITDRREAIRAACRMAQKGDVILIAGKGHEDYQDVKGVKHHFDDREIIKGELGIRN